MDERGIIRLGGRLDRSHLDYEMKHPPIIPAASRLGWLIMEHAHRRCRHGRIQVSTQLIRQKYWIPKIRSELRKFVQACVMCARHKPDYQTQLMGELPAERTRPGKPFGATGVDYAGPVQVKFIDRHGATVSTHKSWIVVFVCLKLEFT